jgi:hypothetical protein
MASKWLHVSIDHAVISRTCYLQGKYICHSTVLAWGGLRFQSNVHVHFKCLFSLAQNLQSVDVRGQAGMESLRIARDDIKACGNIPRGRSCLLEIVYSRREDI